MRRPLRFGHVGQSLSRDKLAKLIFHYRVAGEVIPDFKFKPGFLYNTTRAIAARINQNYDAWPSDQLEKYHRTFIGKPIFVNHTNEDWRTARGVVVASRFVKGKNGDNYVEVIQEVDAKHFPKLAHEIRTGGLDGVSMGVEAGFTICSVCENKATDLHDMCDHIMFHKGEYMRNKKTGKKTLVYESCYKLGFFELSYVFDPADETALVSRVIMANSIPHEEFPVTNKETDFIWSPKSKAYQDHLPPNMIKRLKDPTMTQIYDISSPEEKQYLDPLDFYSPYTPSKQEYHAPGHLHPQSRMSGLAPVKGMSWYKDAYYGETVAPEDIDTLRDESEDDTDDFHHWVASPPELRAPDMDQSKRLDKGQEDEGLDADRQVENVEEQSAPAPDDPTGDPIGTQEHILDEESQIADMEMRFLDDRLEEDDEPVMPINPPQTKSSRWLIPKEIRMARYRYAEDEDADYSDDGDDAEGSDYGYDDGAGDDGQDPSADPGQDPFGADPYADPSQDPSMGGGEPADFDDVHALLDEVEADIDQYKSQADDQGDFGDDSQGDEFGGGDDSGFDDASGDPYADDGSGGGFDDGSGFDQGGGDPSQDPSQQEDLPPWLAQASNGPVRRRARTRNTRGGKMTLATRNAKSRHFTADDNGHTDGGPYGVDDSQGAQEDVFISQVPGAEAVDAPTPGDGQISNSKGSLVAQKRKARRPQFDPAHYQRLADTVAGMPVAQRKAVAQEMVRAFTADNKAFNPITFYKEAGVPLVKKGSKFFFAEDLKDGEKVDPGLSGTDVQDLKGSEFDSVALDDVETQPKDASIHAFRRFDAWLKQVTGHNAREHGNANYISRMAASYCKQANSPQAALNSLFPTMEYVLREARKVEGRTAAMRKRAEDESLSVAAPQGRVDVEAPVKNVTDAEAQASQFDLGDFAHNAGDQIADPELDVVDGMAGTWAPDKGKESAVKLATGTEAMRCAEAYVAAMPNTYRSEDRWRLAAMFETLRQPYVRREIRLLEAVLADRKTRTARKVAAVSSRGTNGIPSGLGSRRTSAPGITKNAATSPETDGLLFMS